MLSLDVNCNLIGGSFLFLLVVLPDHKRKVKNKIKTLSSSSSGLKVPFAKQGCIPRTHPGNGPTDAQLIHCRTQYFL